MNHIITSEWKGDSRFEAQTKGGKVLMSAEGDGGLGPKALMLDSIAGCSGIDVVSILKKMRVTVENFKISVEATLTEEHPKYYDKVNVIYHFTGKELDQEKINKAVNLSVEKYCGVLEMFRKFAEVKTEVRFN